MAINFPTGASLKRDTGAFLSGAANFTIMFHVFPLDLATGSDYGCFHILQNLAYTKYAGFYTIADVPKFYLGVDKGTGGVSTTQSYYVEEDGYHVAYVYDNTAKTAKLYINRLLIDTISIDFSGAVFTEEHIGWDGFTIPIGAVQNYRSWQRALTVNEIAIESASNTAVLTTNLFCDTPLSDASDLLDVSGNNRHWTAVGTPTDYIISNTKFVGVDPPTNTVEASAIVLNSDNYRVVQRVDSGGVTSTIWYKFVATENNVIGFFGYGSATYIPRTLVYINGVLSDLTSADNKPGQIAVSIGDIITFKVSSTTGNVTPSVLSFQLLPAVYDAIADGDLLVNDDTPGFPVAILDGFNGGMQRFQTNFPAGEQGDSLITGTVFYAVTDVDDGTVKVYNVAFAQLNSFVPTGYDGSEPLIRGNKTLGKIYVLCHIAGNSWNLQSISSDGSESAVLETLTLGLTSAQLKAFSLNNPGTVVYLANGNTIKRWNLTTHALIANFATGPVSHSAYDILTLTNDHVLILWINSATGSIQVIEYDTSGTPVATNNWGTNNVHTIFHHIAYSRNDPARYWLWTHPNPTTGTSRFREVTIATGVAAIDFTIVEFETGVYSIAASSTPQARFGVSLSCPFFMVAAAAANNPLSGIYKIVPNSLKDDDTVYINLSPETTLDVEIPDPFADSGLIGE